MVLDYVLPGVFFTVIGLAAAFFIGRESRPGDLLLQSLPNRMKDFVWNAQRAGGLLAIFVGQLFFWYGIWLWVTMR